MSGSSQTISQKNVWHIRCLNYLLKIPFELCLRSWKKVSRFYLSYDITGVGSHIDYSTRGHTLPHRTEWPVYGVSYLWNYGFHSLSISKLFSHIQRIHSRQLLHINSIWFSFWSSNLPSGFVWCFFMASSSVFKGETCGYEEQE